MISYSPKFTSSSTSSSSSDLQDLDLLPELWHSSSNESQMSNPGNAKLYHNNPNNIVIKPSIWSKPSTSNFLIPENLLDVDIHIPSTSTTIGVHDNVATINNKNIYTYNYYGTFSVDEQQDIFNFDQQYNHHNHGQFQSQSSPKNVNTQLYKTELCASYMKMGICPYGNKCQFAHGENELKKVDRPPKWRSKPCANWMKWGSCRYGSRCSFKHD